ncbi:MAG: hypothetical protein ACMXYD_04535 [Candidatus Woesearchaeota archaeon]
MIKNKKGAENVIASLILFIAVMALATTATILFKNHLDTSGAAITQQQSRSTDLIGTNFDIILASYNTGTITAYVKNTGTTRFYPEEIDLYINNQRIPRNPANRTITIVEDTNTINPDVWDPGEELEIEIYKTFSTSQTHTLRVTTPNSASTTEEFSS